MLKKKKGKEEKEKTMPLAMDACAPVGEREIIGSWGTTARRVFVDWLLLCSEGLLQKVSQRCHYMQRFVYASFYIHFLKV